MKVYTIFQIRWENRVWFENKFLIDSKETTAADGCFNLLNQIKFLVFLMAISLTICKQKKMFLRMISY